MIAKTKLGLGWTRAVSKNAFNYDNSAIILVKIIWQAPSCSHAHTDTNTSRRGVWVCVCACAWLSYFWPVSAALLCCVFVCQFAYYHRHGCFSSSWSISHTRIEHTHNDRATRTQSHPHWHTLIEYVWSWCRRRCCVVLAQNLIYTHPKVMQSFGMSIRRRPPSTALPPLPLMPLLCLHSFISLSICTRHQGALPPTQPLTLSVSLCYSISGLVPAQMTHI